MPRNAILIYVRKGHSESERILSFHIPTEFPQKELLEKGFAIDGDNAVYSIMDDSDAWVVDTKTKETRRGPGKTMLDKLLDTQQSLMKWLTEKGYRVRFNG